MDHVSNIDFAALTTGKDFHASPVSWDDQVFYFMMVDRFSDGKEKGYKGKDGKPVASGKTPLFQRDADWQNAIGTEQEASAWRAAGGQWCGGNLKGLTSKIPYLKRMGVTAVWCSPLLKQVDFQPTYHGYGIQDYLSIDPHFGTVDDLRAMVQTAHQSGIYVIMDIIINHAGNVFCYQNGAPTYNNGCTYTVQGFNDCNGKPCLPFGQSPQGYTKKDAIWPAEFQDPACFTRKGRIRNWDADPEFREGDFEDLKDICHGWGDASCYCPSPALLNLCDVYKYWIAATDIDGFRIDTVKHMDIGATRFFASAIREFAQTIGKENFFLLGEITGGRERAFETLEQTGLDAALGIDDVQIKMECLVKGQSNPEDYFNLFRNSLLVQKDSHVWFRDKVVTMINDHDQVCKGANKARFCASGDGDKLMLSALALNAMTLGIPCIYYGSEQKLDGQGGSDRYIRESMFGGAFGAFRSKDRHFFDEDTELYGELGKILELRAKKENLPLRRGRQYLREISGDGINFGVPRKLGDRMLSVVPWSRILDKKEMVLAINTDPDRARKAWVVVDKGLHPEGSALKCIYSTDKKQQGQVLKVDLKGMNKDIAAIELTVPPAGFVMLG